MSLQNELNAIKKGSDSIDSYFQKIKQSCDKLAAVSVFLDDEELLHIALDGLPSKYDSFSYAIRTRSDVLFVEELNTLLNSEERVIKKRSKANAVNPNSVAMAMNFQPQNQGFPLGRGGRNNNQRGRGGCGYNPNCGPSSSGYGNLGYNPNFGGYGNSGYNPHLGPQYNQSLKEDKANPTSQFAKFVVKLVIQQLIAITGWTSHIRENILLPSQP